VLFFYELLFALMTIVAVIMGELWSRLAAFIFLTVWFVVIALGYASFGARLATPEGLTEDDRRFFTDARDGLRHLRLLFGLAAAAALVWRLIAG
jgi:hypothetical protein